MYRSITGVVENSLSGQWRFGRSDRGALLAIAQPRTTHLTWDGPPNVLYDIPLLKGQSLVTHTVTCPAYALYLSNKGDDVFSLAMVSNNLVMPSTVTAGGSFSAEWKKDQGSGFYRDAVHNDADLTPLFSLKQCHQRLWRKRRDSPSPERKGLQL